MASDPKINSCPLTSGYLDPMNVGSKRLNRIGVIVGMGDYTDVLALPKHSKRLQSEYYLTKIKIEGRESSDDRFCHATCHMQLPSRLWKARHR